MDRKELDHRLPQVVEALERSIQSHPKLQHLNRIYLPSREVIIDIIKRLRDIAYPGFFDRGGSTRDKVVELTNLLYDQVRWCLRYRDQVAGSMNDGGDCEPCDHEAAEIVATFWDRVPAVRALLDALAQAFESPACQEWEREASAQTRAAGY
jgi:serine O-acetyltransferase